MDLNMFFKLDQRYGDFKWDFTFFDALYGLASALKNVHMLRLQAKEHGVDLAAIGYHHDLRPANILLTDKTFLLADFSLAKLKSTDDASKTTWKAGTGDYIAPECMDQNFSKQKVGRAIDVWAFGCLSIEVATYMERGAAGLEQFRNERLSASFMPNWYEQYFFSEKEIKPAVHDWFQKLVTNSQNELVADLVQLAVSILVIDPAERPMADQVCRDLLYLSVKALVSAVRKAFLEYLSIGRQRGEDGPPLMRVWFESERINALGTVLGLIGHQVRMPNFSEAEKFFDHSREILLALFRKLNSELGRDLPVTAYSVSESAISLRNPFDEEIMVLVQRLVDMLPLKYQKSMETAWEQSSLDTRDIDRLNSIEINCRSVKQLQYLQVGALAAMKSLRLQFLSGNSRNSMNLVLTKQDVKITRSIQEHFIGLYNNERQVLVEWQSYTAKWMALPTEQRSLLMELKAEGLGVKPKPAGLRILDCLGFFEETTEQYGYGFLYAFPGGYSLRDSPPPTTLLALLNYDLKTQKTIDMQPLLGAKFKLASALVIFLKELHMIGWLHENINSNNILLFGITLGAHLPSERLQEPYVVGFEKSRPDSNIWYTDGPFENSYTDYRNPKYRRESRFIPAYDYYSMGLVLLEIGLWTPLKFWAEKRPYATPHDFRQILIETYVPRLGQKMGKVYRDAVMTCLSGELEDEDCSSSQVDKHGGFGQFLEKVVEPLEELARVTL